MPFSVIHAVCRVDQLRVVDDSRAAAQLRAICPIGLRPALDIVHTRWFAMVNSLYIAQNTNPLEFKLSLLLLNKIQTETTISVASMVVTALIPVFVLNDSFCLGPCVCTQS